MKKNWKREWINDAKNRIKRAKKEIIKQENLIRASKSSIAIVRRQKK